MAKFLNNISLEQATDIQFKTAAGANAGKIEQDGNNLVLSNAVGDILLGDGASDVYIGDGTNNVDIIFEQSGSIKGDGSAVTLTLGGANTTLNLENPNISGNLSIGATTINNKLTFTTNNGYILFDYEPPNDTAEYTTEVPLLKVDLNGAESTILARVSEYRAVVLGIDDTVWLRAGDTGSVIKSNVNLTTEQVLMSAEGGFHAYGFPGNNTNWSNRNEFRFRSDSTTASDNGLYIGDGGNWQFIDINRNITAASVTSTSGHIKAMGGANVYVYDDSDDTKIHVQAKSNDTEGVLVLSNGSNYGLIARGIQNSPRLGAYHAGTLNIYGFGNSSGADHADDDLLAQFNFSGEFFQVNGALDINGNADISGTATLGNKLTINTTLDNKIDLIVPSSGDTSDWNYIQFIGADGTRDAYFGTTNDGTPSWYRDDGGTQLRLNSTKVYSNSDLQVNGELEATSLDINGDSAIDGQVIITDDDAGALTVRRASNTDQALYLRGGAGSGEGRVAAQYSLELASGLGGSNSYDLKLSTNAGTALQIDASDSNKAIFSGAATFAGNLTVTGSTTMAGVNPTSLTTPLIQLQGDLNVLNKAQTSYITLADRDTSGSEVVYNLDNIGTITVDGKIETAGEIEGGSLDINGVADISGSVTLHSTVKIGATQKLYLDGGNNTYITETSADTVRVYTGGASRLQITSAGIESAANVYTGNSSQFRNYGGTWTASTGLTGNGFEFVNSVDGTAMTLSSTGSATFAGGVVVNGGALQVNNAGADKKLSFDRTGGKGISIEHDASSIYFYNETDAAPMFKMFNGGDVRAYGELEATSLDINGNADISGNTSMSGTLSVGNHLTLTTPAGNSQTGYALKLMKTSSTGTEQVGAELMATAYPTNTNGGNLIFKTANSSATATTALTIDGAQHASFVGNVTIAGNLTTEGDLIINNTSNVSIKDTIITLNSGVTTSDTRDIGLMFERVGNNKFFGWDESKSYFTLAENTQDVSVATTTQLTMGTLQTLRANVQVDTIYFGDENPASISALKDEDDMASNSATSLATQQSIKAYADTKLPLAGGTMTGAITMGGDTNMNGYSIYETAEDHYSIDLNDHGGYTWLRNVQGVWTFQQGTGGDNWTNSFQLTLPDPGSTANAVFAELGQKTSNVSDGRYKGVRIVKYASGALADGDLQAAAVTATSLDLNGAADISSNLTVAGDVTVGDDLLFASGAEINFDNNDVRIYHSSDTLTFVDGALRFQNYNNTALTNIAHQNFSFESLINNSSVTNGSGVSSYVKLGAAATNATGSFSTYRGRAYGENRTSNTDTLTVFHAEYRNWTSTSNTTLANHYGFKCDALTVGSNSESVTNNFGIYLNPGTTATNNYGVYQTGSNVTNYFQGKVGINTAPAAGVELHVNGEIRVDGTDGVATRMIRSNYFSSSSDIEVRSGASGDIILGDGTARLTLASNDTSTFVGDVNITNGNIIFSSQYGVRFNDANTRIYTNTDNPEDLIIEADQDLLLTPDGQVRVTGNVDISGALTLGTNLAVAEGGTGVGTNTSWLNANAFASFTSSSADWDTITTRGLYRLTGGTNNPFGTSHATGLTLTENSGNYGFQLFSKGSTNNTEELVYRYRGTSWGDWQTIVTKTFGDNRYLKLADTQNITGTKEFQDSVQLRFGNDADLRMQHTGSHGYIDTYTGDLYIRNTVADKHIYLKADDGNGGNTVYIDVDGDNQRVQIEKPLVLSSGSAVSSIKDEDNMASDSATALATQQSIKAYVDSSVSSAGGGDVTLAGAQTFTGSKTFSADVILQDNVELEFGTGSDVKMKFNGSDLVTTVPTGSAFLIGTNGATPHDNSGNADFAIDVGSHPQISFYDNQVQVGGTNMNWSAKLLWDGNTKLAAWNNDMYIYTQGSSGDSAKNIYINPQSTGGSSASIASFNGDNGTTLSKKLIVTDTSNTVPSADVITNKITSQGYVAANGNTRTGLDVETTRRGWYNSNATAGNFKVSNSLSGARIGDSDLIGVKSLATLDVNNTYSGVTTDGSLTAFYGKVTTTFTTGSSPVEKGYGLRIDAPEVAASSEITTYYGAYIDGGSVSGTLTNKYALITEANAGNVGIATTNPSKTLTVGGTIQSTGEAFFNNLDITNTGSSSRFRSGHIVHFNTNRTVNMFTSSEDLYITNNETDKDIIFRADDGAGSVATYLTIDGSAGQTRFYKETRHTDGIKATFGNGDDLQLYHNGSNSQIDNMTGHLQIRNFADGKNIIFESDDGSGGTTAYLTLDGTNVRTKFHKSVNLEDNVQLQIGNSQDLKLYHNGSHSYIAQAGTGNLYIQNEVNDGDIIFMSDDGSGGVEEYFRLDGDAGGANPTTIFPDNARLAIGSGQDLKIYHSPSVSYIEANNELRIRQTKDDADILLQSDDGGGGITTYLALDGGISSLIAYRDILLATDGTNGNLKLGASQDLILNHDGTDSKIQNITGDLKIVNLADGKDILFQSDNGSGGDATYFRLDGSEVETRFHKATLHYDNVWAKFGDSGDLRIYHDGSNSYIDEAGTGSLIIKGSNTIAIRSAGDENYFHATANGAVKLYHNNSAKFETAAAGVKTSFAATSNTDGDGVGDIVNIGETTTVAGKIYYLNSSGGWTLADADAESTAKGMLAVALGTSSSTNGMLIRGMVTLDHDPGTVGDTLFLHTTAGQASSTAPSGNGDIVRVIGYCLDSTNGQIYFNPDGTFVEVTA